MSGARRVTELSWVLRPSASRPAAMQALARCRVHAMGAVGLDGLADVVLDDGTRLRVSPTEIVAE